MTTHYHHVYYIDHIKEETCTSRSWVYVLND